MKSSRPIQSSSLAETSNWSSQASGNIRFSLFDSVLRDINESTVLESSYNLKKQGQPTSSQSPSYEDFPVKQVTREQHSVSSVAKEVTHMLQTAQSNPESVILSADTHFPPTRLHKVDKRRVTSDEVRNLDARHHGVHTRTQPSKEFKKTLGQVWPSSTRKRYFVSSHEKHQNELTFIIRNSNETETVVIKDFPSCSCSWCLTHPNQVCRHINWVLLYVCDVSCKSAGLFQLAYSDTELQTIVNGAPLTFSHLSVDLKCPILDDENK